jgi:hypothetical protein
LIRNIKEILRGGKGKASIGREKVVEKGKNMKNDINTILQPIF